MNKFKLILIGLFNSSIWCLLLWVFLCAIASVSTWSNFYVVPFSDWDGVARLIAFLSFVAIFICCTPFRKENK